MTSPFISLINHLTSSRTPIRRLFGESISCLVILTLLSAVTVQGQDVPSVPDDTLPAKLNLKSVPVGFDALPSTPEDNPLSPETVELGRKLFFDPILSSNGTVACATCHRPEHGFASPDPVAIGVHGKKGTRNAPTILNAAYQNTFTWDGRDQSLEEQVIGPLTSEVELGSSETEVVAKLAKDPNYVEAFAKAFGQPKDKAVTLDNLTKAIANFERSLIGGNNAVDKFRRQEYTALSKSARTGMWIFESRGGCWKCHKGSNLTDDDFHNTGVSFGSATRDEGRMGVSKDPAHAFQFKTPSLRNIALTAPYMHDGSIKTLREVVEFYNRGGSPDDPKLDDKMKPLGLTDEEVGNLVDFLKALTNESLVEGMEEE